MSPRHVGLVPGKGSDKKMLGKHFEAAGLLRPLGYHAEMRLTKSVPVFSASDLFDALLSIVWQDVEDWPNFEMYCDTHVGGAKGCAATLSGVQCGDVPGNVLYRR